jgi:hypothetical protein
MEGPSKQIFPCVLSNISLRGGEIWISPDIALPKEFVIRLTEDGKIRRGCNLAWRAGERAGVSFFRVVETARSPVIA